MKLIILFVLGLLSLIMFSLVGCSDSAPTDNNSTRIVPNDSTDVINIVDRTGKIWDITYAVSNYGMEAKRFNFGNGPFSFIPYKNPQFFSSGQSGYPSPTDRTRIIGLNFNGEVRAYPISAFISTEVINDRIGDTYIAVTY